MAPQAIVVNLDSCTHNLIAHTDWLYISSSLVPVSPSPCNVEKIRGDWGQGYISSAKPERLIIVIVAHQIVCIIFTYVGTLLGAMDR